MPKRRRRRRCVFSVRPRKKKRVNRASRDHDIRVVASVVLLFLTAQDLAFMSLVNTYWSYECSRPYLYDADRIGISISSLMVGAIHHIPYRILSIVTKLIIWRSDFKTWAPLLLHVNHLRHVVFSESVNSGLFLLDFCQFVCNVPASVRVLTYTNLSWVTFLRLLNRLEQAGDTSLHLHIRGIRGLDVPAQSHSLQEWMPNITALRTSIGDDCPEARFAPNIRFIHFNTAVVDAELESLHGLRAASYMFTSSRLAKVETMIIDALMLVRCSLSVCSSLQHLRIGVFDMREVFMAFRYPLQLIQSYYYYSLHTIEILLRYWFFSRKDELKIQHLAALFNADTYPRLKMIRMVVAVRCSERILPCDYELREGGPMIHWSYIDPVLRFPSPGIMLDAAFKDISPLGTAQQAFDRYCA